MTQIDIDTLIDKTTSHIKEFMSKYDASHDFNHIQRVLNLAKIIESRERVLNPDTPYNGDLITLTALTHDIGDRKYIQPGDDASTMVQSALLSLGCSPDTAATVQLLATHVSWSSEQKDPAKVQRVIHQYPELAIIQDADRLDALGAVGVGRCFAYNAAKGYTMADAIQHFDDKLLSRGMAMKTLSGQEIAGERMKRLREFKRWWEEETNFTGTIETGNASTASVRSGSGSR